MYLSEKNSNIRSSKHKTKVVVRMGDAFFFKARLKQVFPLLPAHFCP
jgi:hypothetical protein